MNNHNNEIRKISLNNNILKNKIKTEFVGLIPLKTITIILLIVLQFAIFVFSYLYLFTIFKYLAIFSIILSILTSIYVLSTQKNGQTKGSWIFFLLLCSSFGYIIYFISDEHIAFRKSKKRYKKIIDNTKHLKTKRTLSSIPINIQLDCNYLETAGDFNTYTNTELKYFATGRELFEDIVKNLENAKNFIFIEFFIISNGKLLNLILKILKEKANQGVDIRIIYDDMGCHGTLNKKTKNLMKSYGIKLCRFNPFIPVFNIAMNYRDHRKIVVIDGKVSYTGGANLADEYINEKRMHGFWKDCGIKIEGKCVDSLTIAFLRQWEFITKNRIDYIPFLNKSKDYDNNSIVVPFVDGLEYSHSIGRDTYINMLSNATKKIYIMTPYFIPDETINDLLKNKALCGVEVVIVLPDVADKKLVYQVSRSNAEKLLTYGVKIYIMKDSFVHSKLVLTEHCVVVGTINIDQRSFNQQFESAVYTNDTNILECVNSDFSTTIKNSIEINFKNQKRNKTINRITAGLFRIISPFM